MKKLMISFRLLKSQNHNSQFLNFRSFNQNIKIYVSDFLNHDPLLKYQEVAVKKFLDQDFSGAALSEFKREVSTNFVFCFAYFICMREMKRDSVHLPI